MPAVQAALGIMAVALAVAATPPALTGPASGSAAATGTADATAAHLVWPVAGPLVRLFEPSASPYGAGHRGVDIAAPAGAPVHAALPGVVTFAGVVAGRRWVTVHHGGGLETTYGDLDGRGVGAGDRVAAGDRLGRLAAGAVHLDWGVRLEGDYVDPLRLLGRWRPRLVPAGGANP